MVVSENNQHRHEYSGKTYRFCSAGCKEKFKAEPGRFLSGFQATDAATPTGTVFTCPMHPEVEQLGAGDCPKCGMALEPKGIPASTTKTEWTCPMHPEVVREEPGDSRAR
jgi:Cu+-exporting ATPase